MSRTHLKLGLCLAVALSSPQIVAATPLDNPHELNPATAHAFDQDGQCSPCHQRAAQHSADDRGNPLAGAVVGGDGVTVCTGCHGEAGEVDSHMVGASPEFATPPDLPLDKEGRITCMTCHVTHGSLTSTRPWASVSWLDRVFDRARFTKTFLLRRNNAHGELCLACHTADGDK